MHDVRTSGTPDGGKAALNKRIEDIGWGLLLIITGGAFLMPGWEVPWATWLVGVGIVMLGLNAARYLNGIRLRGFTMILGVLALAAGLGNFAGVDLELPLFSALLILLGAGIILKPLIERDR